MLRPSFQEDFNLCADKRDYAISIWTGVRAEDSLEYVDVSIYEDR